MKKAATLAFTAALILTSSLTEASLQQRLQWWKARARQLEEKKALIEKTPPADPTITEVTENELRAAREALGIFESYTGSSSGLTQSPRQFSDSELSEKTARLAELLFSLLYFELMVNAAGEHGNLAEARQAVALHIRNMGPCADCGLDSVSAEILGRDITPEQWKVISMEIFVGAMMSCQKEILKTLKDAVTTRLVDHLKAKGTATPDEIDELICNETMSLMSDTAKSILRKDPEKNLAASWCWRSIEHDLEEWRRSCSELRVLIPQDEQISPARIKYLMKYVQELDSLIFDRLGRECTDAVCAAAVAPDVPASAQASLSLKSVTAGILGEVDSIRKSSSRSVTGRETADYFDALKKEFDSAVSKHFQATRKNPANGHNQKNGGMEIKDASSPETAALREQSKKYAEKSLAFVSWIARSRQRENAGVMDLYRYRIDRSIAYISFMKGLAARCPELASRDSQEIHSRFSVAVSRSFNVIKSIESTVSPDRIMLSRITAKEIISCREMRRDFSMKSTETGLEISGYLQKFVKDRNQTAHVARFNDSDLKNKIAQYEIDHFMDTAKTCARLHGALRYNEDALNAYLETFARLKRDAAAGASVFAYDGMPSRPTLIPACRGFDEKRLAAERDLKTFLKKECDDSLARAASLIGFYRRSGVTVETGMQHDELEEIKSTISRHYTVGISSWKMDERNYREVDAKAFYEMARAARISAVRSGQSSGAETRPNRTVLLTGSSMSFYLPGQWAESPSGDLDRMKGTISSYSNPLTDSSIQVASLPGGDRTIQEISDEWIKKEGMRAVRWRTLKKNDHEFCWAIAGDGKNRIMETYAIILENQVLIVSGTTDRSRRGEFSRTLGAVIDSMDF